MFARKDEKALFRMGTKVTHDYFPHATFKVTAKSWTADGNLLYTVENRVETHVNVRQKDLTKA